MNVTQHPLPPMTLMLCVDASAVRRMQRLEAALGLLRNGYDRAETMNIIAAKFSVSKVTAWRTVTMALDLQGEVVTAGVRQ